MFGSNEPLKKFQKGSLLARIVIVRIDRNFQHNINTFSMGNF